MGDAAIEIRNLRRVYKVGFFRREVVALQSLDMTVPKGSLFGFIGPNGAGKTTTIKLLAGLSRPDGGSARVLGIDCSKPEARERVGFLPERPYFYPNLVGNEILDLYGALVGLDKTERRKRAAALLERVGLSHAADRRLGGYSKGMLQRIGMAQALIGNPEVVILDEPMSGLDPMGRALIRDMVHELKEAGKTVLMCTHILSDVEHLCDELALINRGRLVFSGPVAELMSRHGGDVEILVRGLPADATAGLPDVSEGESRGELRLFRAPDFAAADRFVDRARAAGASLESLRATHRTLEEIVVDVLAEENDA